MGIGKKLYELRTNRNWSQEDLAERLNVSRQAVSKWETDAAVPELDKLIKMCDVFGITLDELTNRSESPCAERIANGGTIDQTRKLQKALGSMLLGLSVLVGVFTGLFADTTAFLLVFFPIALTLFVCSIICLCVKQRAIYWCIWAVLSSVSFLTPHVIGLGMLSVFNLLQVAGMVVLGFVAARLFREKSMAITRQKSSFLVLVWVLFVTGYVISVWYVSSFWLVSFLLNYAIMAIAAGLETYTACYIKNAIALKKRQ